MTPEYPNDTLTPALEKFDADLERFAEARLSEPKPPKQELLSSAQALMLAPGGLDALYARVSAIESAGVFAKTDWGQPSILQPVLAERTLRHGEPSYTVFEAISEIRLLAVASGDYFHPGISAEQARHFLTQVMALNLDLLSEQMSEADRERPQALGKLVHTLYQYMLERLGYESILENLVEEVWRLLAQRPVQADDIKQMISQIAKCLFDPAIETAGMDSAARLVNALFSPTPGCREDPGLEIYAQRLAGMDDTALVEEARGFARAMHETGLVSSYHPMLVRHLRDRLNDLLPEALGLSSTGHEVLRCYPELVNALIEEAIYPETSQAVYGLTLLLERGALFTPPVASALWRQIELTLAEPPSAILSQVFGEARPPRVFLLAGVLSLLGQPLGVGQGNNPTCQSVIGISMWAYNDADYLLQLVAWAARDDKVMARFEGKHLSSHDLEPGLAKEVPLDVDPVSLILVPHLDRIYMEMGRLCGERDDDLHRWINPEFYGWWVGYGFRVVVDIHTGELDDYEGFVRLFYVRYHPYYNGNLPLIHPQPAGIAVTDSAARLVGRHAITVLRVALDPQAEMRVYFYNPNNDSGQDWGQGITCETQGHGEWPGEASLPIAEFASRLYVFHYDPLEYGDVQAVPAAEVERVMALGRDSWAKEL
jgi:hypothetical protein